MTDYHIARIMQLAGLLATARCRAMAVRTGIAGPGINGETFSGTEKRVGNAERELRSYLESLP